MYDHGRRLTRALPQVRSWIAELRARHAGDGEPAAARGFSRLPNYFSGATLSSARVVVMPAKLPFPPVSDLGIAFAELAQMALSAVTYEDVMFVHHSQQTERTYFHELVHVVQWRALGVDRFLLTYGAGLLQHGYARSPLEAIAYDLQSQFDRDVALPDLESVIAAHARDTASGCDHWFKAEGK